MIAIKGGEKITLTYVYRQMLENECTSIKKIDKISKLINFSLTFAGEWVKKQKQCL